MSYNPAFKKPPTAIISPSAARLGPVFTDESGRPHWHIDNIVDARRFGTKQKLKYRVRWLSYGPEDDTWESRHRLKDTAALDRWETYQKIVIGCDMRSHLKLGLFAQIGPPYLYRSNVRVFQSAHDSEQPASLFFAGLVELVAGGESEPKKPECFEQRLSLALEVMERDGGPLVPNGNHALTIYSLNLLERIVSQVAGECHGIPFLDFEDLSYASSKLALRVDSDFVFFHTGIPQSEATYIDNAQMPGEFGTAYQKNALIFDRLGQLIPYEAVAEFFSQEREVVVQAVPYECVPIPKAVHSGRLNYIWQGIHGKSPKDKASARSHALSIVVQCTA
ncbi:hypothetical protein NMY22_g18194 [Coprinellus aureogranulatus]|nr:hypothetical protein NMY22_g18194 [Coprinellus aureogranulatus]